MKFTDKIAQFLLEQEYNYQELTIILPSQRAIKYLSSSLYKQHQKPILAPKMITMDAWIRELVDETILDKTRLLIELFKVYQEIPQIQHETFDEFIEWGSILISDFDELDRYLVDSSTIFKDLRNIKDLEYWKLDADEDFKLSDARKRFLKFWDQLPMLYQKLNGVLKDKNAKYMGAAYRKIAENIDIVLQGISNRRFIFAGFNAMSKSELSIIKQLHKFQKAQILIDADSFYLDDKNHEAGLFIRKQLETFQLKTVPFVEHHLLNKKMNIEVIACTETTGQVKVAASKLMNMKSEDIANTLLLLADESLITPMLKNIPKNVGKANITLGMPMKGTAVKNWVDILFQSQEILLRFNNHSAIYHETIKRIFKHPFFTSSLQEKDQINIQNLEDEIVKKNWIFVAKKHLHLNDSLKQFIDLITSKWNNWLEALIKIRELNQLIYSNLKIKYQFEKALVQSFDNALIDFENVCKEGLPEMSLKSFQHLFNQQWSNKGIAYYGNPTHGLQIMGLLETRMLDFDHLICLGLNEGILPSTNPIQSLFPMDLRRYAEMPLPRDKQGIFAHHFYRLLHQAQDALITYTTAKESIGSNEKSRYLMQLEKELLKQNQAIDYKHSLYKVSMRGDVRTDIKQVAKTDFVLKQLDEVFEKSTSTSKMAKYYKCPLDFYYRYVLNFGEEEDVEEYVEQSTFGTIVHETFETLYTKHACFQQNGEQNPNGSNILTVGDIDEMLLNYEKILISLFSKLFSGDKAAFQTGKNKLSFEIAKKMIYEFLHQERKTILEGRKIRILHLEKSLEFTQKIKVHNEIKTIRVNGIIDRVDEIDGKVRLIDYKTGKCDSSKVSMSVSKGKTWLESNKEKSFFMQLLMYCYLYDKTQGTLPDFAGIISMKSIKSGLYNIHLKDYSMREVVDEFQYFLQAFLEEVYDISQPFQHVDHYMFKCDYCD